MFGADTMLNHAESAENINYSFGNGRATDADYKGFDAFFDAFIDNFDTMFSKSTGNGGYGTTTITHPAPAYNLMASANMQDQDTVTRDDDFITSSSSRGPTLGGRKKPDITAPGTNSMTTNRLGTFSNLGGTSSASPHTGGGVLLLTDLGVPNPTAAKAVLLNSAITWTDSGTQATGDDGPIPGSAWNKTYGWGYLDLGAAFVNGTDVFSDTVDDTPEDADFNLYKGRMFDNEKATLAWKRHIAYSGAIAPPASAWEDLSDLDLSAWREADNTTLAASESHIDNVEQIAVAATEDVVIKVEAFGLFDPDIPIQEYALATEENFTRALPPTFDLQFDHPATVQPSEQFTVTVDVANTGEVAAHNNAITLTGVTIVNGPNPQPLGTIAAGQRAAAVWTVQAPAQPGQNVTLNAQNASDSYGEAFAGSGDSSFSTAGTCPADLNGDGVVDLADLGILLADFGCAPPGPCVGDINGDGSTDLADLGILLSEFGNTCP
jgi:hypothetical protein